MRLHALSSLRLRAGRVLVLAVLIEAVLPPALSPCFPLPSLTAIFTLQKSDPRKTFPELNDDMLGNMKRLKKSMSAMDWQVSAGSLLPIPSRSESCWRLVGRLPAGLRTSPYSPSASLSSGF